MNTAMAALEAADRRAALRRRMWGLLPRAHGGSAEARAEAVRLLAEIGWLAGLDEAGRAMVAEAFVGPAIAEGARERR